MRRIEMMVRYNPDRFPTKKRGLIALPDHPCAGFLDWVLRRYVFSWLRETAPEDLYQQAAVFLLEQTNAAGLDLGTSAEEVHDTILGTKEKRDKFVKAAQHSFYEFLCELGYNRPRVSGGYMRKHEATGLMWREAERNEAEDSRQTEREYAAIMKALAAPEDKQLFEFWFQGATQHEIARFLGCDDLDDAWLACRDLVTRARRALEIELDAPLPRRPPKGEPITLRGTKPNPDTPRVMVGSPARLKHMKLTAIMALFNVSKATASRIRRLGFYCPGHRFSTTTKVAGATTTKPLPPVPPEVEAVLTNPVADSEGRVRLPESIRGLRPRQIMDLFRVSEATAFAIRDSLIWRPTHRAAGPRKNRPDPEIPPEVLEAAEKWEVDDQGRLWLPASVRTLRVRQIAELFDITLDTARHARSRRYLRVAFPLPPHPSAAPTQTQQDLPDETPEENLPPWEV